MARSVAVIIVLLAISRSTLGFDAEFFTAPTLTYPVVTHTMASAVREIDEPLTYRPLQSVAVVGADDISAHWLRINNDYLLSIGALGLVVNVESPEQLDILRRYTEIPLIASSGKGLEQHFGRVYPILVDATAGRVRQ